AAELAHADVERNARPRRGLVEDHRKRLALERLPAPVMCLQPGLHVATYREHVAQLRERNLADVEEVTRSGHHPAAFIGAAASAAQACSRHETDWSISASLTIRGARKRTTLSPAPTVSSFRSRNAATRSPEGTTALTPTSKPSPRTSDSTDG